MFRPCFFDHIVPRFKISIAVNEAIKFFLVYVFEFFFVFEGELAAFEHFIQASERCVFREEAWVQQNIKRYTLLAVESLSIIHKLFDTIVIYFDSHAYYPLRGVYDSLSHTISQSKNDFRNIYWDGYN
jgi:hypothetical protein